jgi:predicted membrane protein
VSVITIRLTQVALAAMALTAGGSKLAGPRTMVNVFDAIRLGQWFRDVGRAIEISSPRVERQQ